MDQSEGRILYHMTGFTASVFLEVWDRVFWWGLVPLGQHGIEATGSDVMASGRDVIKPEVTSWETGNQRQTTWFGKKHFIQRSGLVCGLS